MSRRQLEILIALLVLGGGLIAFFILHGRTETPVAVPPPPAVEVSVPAPAPPPAVAPEPERPVSVSLAAPDSVLAGAKFSVRWWGPDDPDDFVTIVGAGTPEKAHGDHKETRLGRSLRLQAPIEPGPAEIRYVAGRSKKVLGRTPITILPIPVTITAPGQAVLGSTISVTWSGPNNPNDTLAIVLPDSPDEAEDSTASTSKGSPLDLIVPSTPGEAEIRYTSGTDHKVLGRRSLTITLPMTRLSAPEKAPAGSAVEVKWIGPGYATDRITIVPQGAPDSEVRNYTKVGEGTSLKVLTLIDAGPAELRYTTGKKGRVLARSHITLTPVTVTLKAPAEVAAGSSITVEWTGPAYDGDYLTVVPMSAAAGGDSGRQDAKHGSPARISAPAQAGPAEIRYISGQGARVLGRQSIMIVPAVPPTGAKGA